jgi:DNA-binding transcriptional LysR family regulator
MQILGFGHLSFSGGGISWWDPTVSLRYDKDRENEITVLFAMNNTEARMQNLEPLLIFITVAEMGSFTHAADSLGIQKGRASTSVRKLEEELGVRLLHRTTRSVQLTEDGRLFHARARDLLADVDDLHSMFAGDRVALRGRLRVDLPTEVARATIVPALPDFMATHPELELELSSTDRQVDLVQEGFDCVLRLGPIGDEMLIARPLGKLRMVNAASPTYLARQGVPRALADLRHQEHRTIHFGTTLGARPSGWEYPDGENYATLQLPGALHVNSAQTYEAAALAGLGLIQAPLLGVGRYLESGALVEILPEFRRRSLAVSLVVAHPRNLSRRVRAFMKWIENVLAPHLE